MGQGISLFVCFLPYFGCLGGGGGSQGGWGPTCLCNVLTGTAFGKAVKQCQGCIQKGTSEVAPVAVKQAVAGRCQSPRFHHCTGTATQTPLTEQACQNKQRSMVMQLTTGV